MSDEPISIPMTANFDGLIKLIATSLYAESDVFLRELLQNAHDAIIMRQALDPQHVGRIDVVVDSVASTLTVIDNGIGLDESDIRQFLSVIGSSNKTNVEVQVRGARTGNNIIGQFGIGLLSSFIVATEVKITTTKVGHEKSYTWRNAGASTCELGLGRKSSPGSEVVLKIDQKHLSYLASERLSKIIKKYMDLLPDPIYLNGDGPVNQANAPWHRSAWEDPQARETTCHEFLDRRFPDLILDVIPIEIHEPLVVRGGLFITDRRTFGGHSGGVDIFVKRVLVRAEDKALLPEWATFVRGVVECTELPLNAARDSIMYSDARTATVRQMVGEAVIARLKYLAHNDEPKFVRINNWHSFQLKAMAASNDEFFSQVGELLTFDTNKGPLSLRAYVARSSSNTLSDGRRALYYFSYMGAANQFFRLSAAKDWTVIDAGGVADVDLLKKFAKMNPATVALVSLDETDHPELLAPLENDAERAKFDELESDIMSLLVRNNGPRVIVATRRFLPPELPTVLIVTPEHEDEASLRDYIDRVNLVGGFEDAVRSATRQQRDAKPLRLFLNANNRLVAQLARSDRRGRVVSEILLGLFNSSFLNARNLLTDSNAATIHAQFVRLFEQALELRQESENLKEETVRLNNIIRSLSPPDVSNSSHKAEHISLFMIMPFADMFGVVKKIFESEPYYFEVKLARDEIRDDYILDHLRKHMQPVHGFIADITDLKPNIMFELGAAMMPGDGRPIFCLQSRHSDSASDDNTALDDKVPADIAGRMRIRYGSPSDTPEALEKAIRQGIENKGETAHQGIFDLLFQRRKRFLSRTLLASSIVKLSDEQITAIRRRFNSIEDFVIESSDAVATATGLQKYIIEALQHQLQQLMQGEG
jgi:HSP90 family molecular chaperone